MMELSQKDFERLYQHIQRNYGIDLSKKRQLIMSRLSNTLQAKGYSGFEPFVDDIIAGKDKDMITVMLNKLTTNYTYFMREESHYEFLQDTVMPEIAKRHERDHVISIWSAACSSGEEPYNISMYLLEYFSKLPGVWDTRILASDISQNILATAMNPEYPPESLEKLPTGWQKKYFIKKPNGNFTVTEALKKNVIFRPFNLMDPIKWKIPFDLIFCRNVMIYFDQPTKDALVNRFYNVTVPGGYLFIGHSEGITKSTCPYQFIKPAIYQRKA